MAQKFDLLFSGLADGLPDAQEAFEFGELGFGAFAGVYGADVFGGWLETGPLASQASSKNGQLMIAGAQVVLGGLLGFLVSKHQKPIGYGLGAGAIGAGLNRAILALMNGQSLPGVKPWAFQPSAGALPAGTHGFGDQLLLGLGAAPTLVQDLQGLGAAPTLVQDLGDPSDDGNLPFLS